ncbi:hypothetical protein [Rhodopirellula bahusiensis]
MRLYGSTQTAGEQSMLRDWS